MATRDQGHMLLSGFCKKTKVLNTNTLTPTALTILIAESNPSDKEKIIALVTTLISG